MKRVYHTALKDELFENSNICNVEFNGNLAYTLDIANENKFPYSYDLIYSEPAWKYGYEKFLERTGKSNSSDYMSYVKSIVAIIENTNVPVVLILGKHIIKKYPEFNSKISVNLNGYNTFAYGWRIDLSKYEPCSRNYDLIEKLSNDYSKVWDFSCGYGNTGKIFIDNNKKCVLTDISSKCITYIAENLLKRNYDR